MVYKKVILILFDTFDLTVLIVLLLTARILKIFQNFII